MAVAEEMSQSPNPKDTQALLQSMLQRLKLQPGKEGQADLHTPVHTTAASTWGQDGERGASNLQKVSSGHVNGFEFGTNGVPSKEFSAADSNHCLKDELIEKPSHGCEVDRNLISFPSQKDNTDGDKVEDRVLGQAGVTPTGPGQLFPDASPKDAHITSFERTGGVKMGFGSSAITSDKDGVTRPGQKENQDQSFKPRKYVWSSKPTDANLDTQSRENEGLHVGNGGFGAQSKDTQVVPTNSSSRRKSQSTESKTRRWTQKIKEKWRDRPGSFGKKEKGDKKNEQGAKISAQDQLLEHHVIHTLKEEESSDPSNTPTHTVDNNKECMRPPSDFEFGLGSFSLLDEIVTGQEWANFLDQSAASADHRQSQLRIPPNLHENSRSSLMNQQGGVNTQHSFTGAEDSPDFDFSMAQISPDAFQAVSMDVSEGKLTAVQDIHREADHSEPMEHGQTRRSSVEPAAILNNSALKRAHLNRKRQHQRRDENLQTEKNQADGVRSVSLLSPTSNHVKEERGESQHDDIMPLHTLNTPSPSLSPSSPFAPAPRGVLKHSISRDSQISMETVTKRRRVEENRHVHFSEEVVAIAPPELNLDALDLEEDWGEEEDSVTEEEFEEEQAEREEVVAAARRPALPAWIQALKRMNAGLKHKF